MITYLRVRNLAIVEELAIEPGTGLNVLTGETGAGKSLLIDSLGFLSGARGSTSMIRSGEDKLSAEAVFHLPSSMDDELREMGIEVEGGAPELELIVRRELAEGGRSRVLVNGSVVTVRELSAAMDRMLEIHGQNESLDRIAGQSFRHLLDQFGRHEPLLDRTRALYDLWKRAADELSKLAGAQRDRELRLDLLSYQISEITSARLESGEEEKLGEERAMLAHAQELAEATSKAFAWVSEEEASAIALVSRAAQQLAPLARVVTDLGPVVQELEDARIRLQEAARSIAHLADSVRHDPARLEQVEERLALIEKLRKKYGSSIQQMLAHLESIRGEHERLSDYESTLEKTRGREASALGAYRSASEDLSRSRHEAAGLLQKAVVTELRDLAMDGTRIEVRTVTSPSAGSRVRIGEQEIAFGPEGWDRVEVWIAPNRGEELRPIQKVASGGELSRIQLAIAAALFKHSERSAGATLVFDEIDAGIGGRVADAVGSKLQELARHNQVVCVTHLPQIASFGSTHFHVWKEEIDGRTRARVSRLDDPEARVREIARMLGGEESTAKAHARELLARSRPAEVPKNRKRSSARAVS